MADVEVLIVGLDATIRQLERAGRAIPGILGDAANDAVDVLIADVNAHRPKDTFQIVELGVADRKRGPDVFGATLWTGTNASGKGLFGKAVRTPTYRQKSGKSAPFRVAAALNYAADRYHYRSGPFMGSRTTHWFSGAWGRSSRRVKGIITKAQDQIEKELGF